MARAGGFSAVSELAGRVTEIASEHRPKIEELAGRSFDKFEVVKAQQQVVAGMNYRIKIRVAEDEHAHVHVYDQFGTVTVNKVETGKGEADEL